KSEASSTTPPSISEGLGNSSNKILLYTSFLNSLSLNIFCVKFVSTHVGATAFTLILYFAHSTASALANCNTPLYLIHKLLSSHNQHKTYEQQCLLSFHHQSFSFSFLQL